MMNSKYESSLATAAAIATALALATPGFANPLVSPTVLPAPDDAAVAEHCGLDPENVVLDTASGLTINPEAHPFDLELSVSVTFHAADAEFTDLTATISQQAGTPGIEAVAVFGNESVSSDANVYCYTNVLTDSGLVAPSVAGSVPTRFKIYWSRGPCLLLQVPNVQSACAVYNGAHPGGPKETQAAHYLQEHLVAPQEPINVCGCPYDDNGVVKERIATFCNPTFGAQGACPTSGGDLTGLDSQAAVTSGSGTCQRVVIGGRAFFIGDTCE